MLVEAHGSRLAARGSGYRDVGRGSRLEARGSRLAARGSGYRDAGRDLQLEAHDSKYRICCDSKVNNIILVYTQ